MGKKKDAAKAAKKRAKLEAREAELAAELERRAAEKKAKKKAKKKGGKKKAKAVDPTAAAHEAVAEMVITAEAEAPVAAEAPSAARAEVIDEEGQTRPEVIAKRKAEKEATAAEIDAAIAERLEVKKAARKKGKAAIVAEAETIDLSDHEAVMAYNLRAVAVGATMLTSDQEREKIAARGEAAPAQVAEVVETDRGREFAVGESSAATESIEFAKPSEAAPVLEEGRNGYKIIQLGADGKPDPRKVRQLTRVTTFVNNIDDETTLKKWDKRKVIEGLAANLSSEEPLIARVNDIVHRRDTAIAKAERQDRKGKLGIGEVGALIEAAEKEAKDALDEIADQAAEIAGRHAKARGGQHLHTLAEISDAEGIDRVREMHENDETIHNDESGEDVPVTETDLASIEAYALRMDRLGAKVIHSEAVIVNDAMGYAGRLDRIIMCKLPELVVGRGTADEYVRPADQRARRYVADIKSGRIDLGGGKIGRQLAAYALGDLYDLETGERSRHSASRDVALVFHLPQGKGMCTVHVVDLKAGAALLKLSAEVRRARNTGKKVLDATVDIADPAPESEA